MSHYPFIYFFILALLGFPFELFANRQVPASRGYRFQYRNSYPQEWTRYPRRMPAYYFYYAHPSALPPSSNLYYSFPSYYRNWTYPSYPYNGRYYVNSTPIRPKYINKVPSFKPLPPQPIPIERETSTGVFFSE